MTVEELITILQKATPNQEVFAGYACDDLKQSSPIVGAWEVIEIQKSESDDHESGLYLRM